MINIIKKPVKNYSNRNGLKPAFIVNHIAEGSIDGMFSWFNNPKSKASANYGVSKKGEIYEFVDPTYKAFTNGIIRNFNDGKFSFSNPIFAEYGHQSHNGLSITIELEGYTGKAIPVAQYKALLELHIYLIKTYNIKLDRDHIIGHYRIDPVDRLFCPGKAFPWEKLFRDLGIELMPERVKFEDYADALLSREIITNKKYWLIDAPNVGYAKGEWVALILQRVTNTKSIDDAVKSLLNKNIKMTPDYWINNCASGKTTKWTYVKVLLMRIVNEYYR